MTDQQLLTVKSYDEMISAPNTQRDVNALKSVSTLHKNFSQNPFTLHFNDKELEKEFCTSYYGKNYLRIRVVLIIALLFWITILPLQEFVMREEESINFVGVGFRVGVIVIMAICCILVFLPFVSRNTVAVEMCAVVGITSMGIASGTVQGLKDHYSDWTLGLMIGMLIGMRIRVYVGAIPVIVAWFCYAIALVLTLSLSNTWNTARDIIRFVMLMFGTLFCVIKAVFNEKYIRKVFELKQIRLDKKNQVQQEQERSLKLLENIIPASLVTKIKRTLSTTLMNRVNNASVLFSDIVGFTEFCSSMTAQQVVEYLNKQYSGFDHYCNKYQLEKIKTIGDAYLCVGGMQRQRNHAQMIIKMAIKMMKIVDKLNHLYKNDLRLRIGIALGEIVAGVFGKDKITFDIFGDTVRIAQRMESTSIPGCIQVTKALRDEVSQSYNFVDRGYIFVPETQTYVNSYILVQKDILNSTIDMQQLIETIKQDKDASINIQSTNEKNAKNSPTSHDDPNVVPTPEKPSEPVSQIISTPSTRDDLESPSLERQSSDENLERSHVLQIFKNYRTEAEYWKQSNELLRWDLCMHQVILTMIHLFNCTAIFALHTKKIGTAQSISIYCITAFQCLLTLIHFIPQFAKSVTLNLITSFSSLLTWIALIIFYTDRSPEIQNDSYMLEFQFIFQFMGVLMPSNKLIIFKIIAVPLLILEFLLLSWFRNYGATFLLLALMLFFILMQAYSVSMSTRDSFVYKVKAEREQEKLEKDQRKNQKLISSLLPKDIVERLIISPESVFDSVRNASVCYVSISGFMDEWKENQKQAFQILTEIFNLFDKEIIKNGDYCEKIKSIENNYIYVSGCPKERADHLYRNAILALRFNDLVRQVLHTFSDTRIKGVNIGISCGDFVAGVLGTSKYLYDVFGDTGILMQEID